jgi:2-polyprenyl-3-methyl-5-hydroxy-6-metoxy-1,4-benzoquinol methylase
VLTENFGSNWKQRWCLPTEETMDARTIETKKSEVIAKYGPWTAHNVHLQDDLYTIGPRIVGDEVRLRRITQIVFDLMGGTVENARILDLACLEGLFAIEFARHKANCVGIEGREANIEKARFVKDVLSLNNLELFQDDVRNLSVEKYGRFDVVLCLGILYHLDQPDVFTFMERLSDVCQKVCIVDTRITLRPKTHVKYKDQTYFGETGEEHDAGDSKENKLARLWASLDNTENFYLSRATLCNALSHAGFTSIYQCNVPGEPDKPEDRIAFVAMKGQVQEILNSPLMKSRTRIDMPERPRRERSVPVEAIRQMSHLLPPKVRRIGKRLIGKENKLT